MIDRETASLGLAAVIVVAGLIGMLFGAFAPTASPSVRCQHLCMPYAAAPFAEERYCRCDLLKDAPVPDGK